MYRLFCSLTQAPPPARLLLGFSERDQMGLVASIFSAANLTPFRETSSLSFLISL